MSKPITLSSTAADPVRALVHDWLPFLALMGVLYLSLPSANNVSEKERLATPLEHILDDYFLKRGEQAYESREHIYSFILGWTAMRPAEIWYATEPQFFAQSALKEASAGNPDLHWHTNTLGVTVLIVEISFWLAGFSYEWLSQQETENDLHLICRRAVQPPIEPPAALQHYRERLLRATALCGSGGGFIR